jgi:short-subunit dehydrogenase
VEAFRDKRALVTGGSAGIGLAIATALAARGARVTIVARTATTLEQAAAEIGATPMTANLASPEAAAALADRYLAEFGGIDILVLCSGIYRSGPISGLADGALEELLANNLIAPAALARRLAPALAQSRGDVLVVNSSAVKAPNVAGRAYFAAGQQALLAFTNGLRDEFNDAGLRVTSLFPGTTATPRQERMHEAAGRRYQPERLLQSADVAQIALAALSLPPTAEATDIHVRPRYKILPG